MKNSLTHFLTCFFVVLFSVCSVSVFADTVLSFQFTSSAQSNDASDDNCSGGTVTGWNAITTSDFHYSGELYSAVKTHERSSERWTGFASGAKACTREDVALSAGTYKFILRTLKTEHSDNFRVPQITVDGNTYSISNVNYTSDYEIKELQYDVTISSAGEYPILITCVDGDADKFWMQTLTIVPVCTSFSFHSGTDNNNSDWTISCFEESTVSDGNGGYLYLIENYTIPNKPNFYVGWAETWATTAVNYFNSYMAAWSDMPFHYQHTSKTLGTVGTGNNVGAIGTLCIYGSYTDNNKYVDFIPGGYVLQIGSAYDSYDFNPESNSIYETVWTTDMMILTDNMINNNIQVLLKTASGAVWNPTYSQTRAVNGNIGQKSGASTWGANLSASDIGKSGKFRIWADNTTSNWCVHFVPYHKLAYDANGGSGAPTTDYVSVETSPCQLTVSNTQPTRSGYAFLGWNPVKASADAGTKDNAYDPGDNVSMTGDVTLYAVWEEVPTYAVTVNRNNNDYGTVTGAGSYGAGETVSITATPNSGYRFVNWTTSSGVTFADATSASTSFTMIASAVIVQANFEIDPCTNTMSIQCEDYIGYTTKPSGSSSNYPTGLSTNDYTGYGTPEGGLYAECKGTAGEMWMPVTLPAGNYTFTARCGHASTMWFNLYNASTGAKLQSYQLLSSWDNNFGNHTTSAYDLPAGTYVIGLSGDDGYSAFDQIVITASTNVFCPDLTYTINSLPWSDSGKDLTEGVVVSNVALSCFDTQITFTFSGAGTVQYYANNDRTTPLGTLTSGTPLALTDALRTYGIYIESTGAATLTAVSKTTVGHVYNIWTGSCSVSADYTGVNELGTTVTILASSQPSEWLQQVVLGPEHFQTAQVGDTLRVSYESGTIGSEPKGAIQTADNYASLLGNIYDNSNGALISTNETRTFDLPTYGYYHLITAGSLAQLKTKGIVVKGRVHTITGVSLHAACGNTTLRTSAPDITHVVKDDGRGTDIMVAPIEFDPRFALGNWEHKLWVDHTCFANVTVGTVINFYMQVHPDSTISFRCNVPDIIADDKTGGVGCPSYGDISFDRTIDSLYGHGPKTVGSIIDYRVMWLVVDADMLRRLNETGLIVCGKNCEISKIWAIPNPIIVYPGENKTVPTVVNCIEIYQGGEVANTEDVKVLGTITYHRPTHDDGTSGKLGNKLDQWYTFTLPFTVDSSQVYDVTDARWWDINAVYYTTDGAQPENNPNPTGAGHYYLQWLKSDGENTGVEEVFRARWQYINPSHSLYLRAADYDAIDVKRYGYPMRDSAYIILYDTQKPLGSNYFNANYQVRFMGGPQTIEGVAKQWKVNASGNQFWLYANNTLHSFTFSGSAYVLDAQGEYFVLQDNPTIRPFECYVQATDSYKRKCSYISILGSHNSATGIEIVDPDDTQCTKVLRDGKLFIIRNNRWYDVTGSRVR